MDIILLRGHHLLAPSVKNSLPEYRIKATIYNCRFLFKNVYIEIN